MRTLQFRIIFASATLSVAASSFGVVISFASQAHAGTGISNLGSVFSQGGFDFSLDAGPYGSQLGTWGDSDPNHPFGGTASTALTSYYASNFLTITRTGGGAFDFTGIEMAEWGASQSGVSFQVHFVGTKSDLSTVTQDITVLNNPGAPILQGFSFVGFTDLTSVTFQQGLFPPNAWQFNNVQANVFTPTPEPFTMGLGLSGAALFLRRRLKNKNA